MSRLKKILALALLVAFVGGISSCGAGNGLAKSKGLFLELILVSFRE